ncbi:DinB family protein [Dyadobacter arcticus]|uniref:DinB-like domain-containing protein n=1 Tax=Dyadobacter arcticus TaxID=1078754 RepID=A0ABX0UTB2_9BACT|nr:DinB family protein [Dyadobacter arcticus]NIJ55020.1 hypothetical protein [Dyadobacter arcticus]
MLNTIKDNLWTQFGASIDMLKNAINLWPDEYWETDKRFFYMTYHTLVFLDYYLTIPPPNVFSSPLPFTFTDWENAPADAIDDIIPDEIYSKAELLDYLQSCREKCYQVVASLTPEKLEERWIEEDGDMDYAVLEILLYNMRHVQHHAAQLNLLLRQKIDDAPRWVSRAE